MTRFYQTEELKIEGAVNVQYLESFYMKEQLNEHMYFCLSGGISEKDAEVYERKKLLGEVVRFLRTADENERLLGTGIIDSAEIMKDGRVHRIQLKGHSLSFRLTLEKKRRSFQNTELTYKEMAGRLSGGSVKTGSFSGVNKTLGTPFIQYEETDWEALCRLTGRFHAIMVPSVQSGDIRIISGDGVWKAHLLDAHTEPEVLIYRDNSGKTRISCKFYQNMDIRLGEKLIWNKKEWITAVKETVYKNGMLETQFLLGRIKDWEIPSVCNPHLHGISLCGTVLHRKKEWIKLWLDIDHEQAERDAYWHPYLPDTGNIMYAMPEEGTRAVLYFPNAKEQDGIVVRGFLDKEYENDRWNPSIKKLETSNGKNIRFWPGLLEIAGGKNCGGNIVCLGRNTGIQVASEKPVRIEASGEIEIKAGLSCDATAVKQIVLKQSGEKNKIEMSGNQLIFQAEKYSVSSMEHKSRKVKMNGEKTEYQSFPELQNVFMGMMAQGECGKINDKIAGGIPALGATRGDLSPKTQTGLRIKNNN